MKKIKKRIYAQLERLKVYINERIYKYYKSREVKLHVRYWDSYYKIKIWEDKVK